MKKKIVSLALVASLLALVIVGGTLAYFTDTENATNTFVIGNVDITLTESSWTAPEAAVPGFTYAKNPVITNTGTNDAYVRLKVTFDNYGDFVAAGVTDLRTMLQGVNTEVWTAIAEPAVSGDTVTYTYTYNTILVGSADPAAATAALFTGVQIPGTFDNADMQTLRPSFNINVVAEAIQAEGFANVTTAFAAYDAQAATGSDMDGDAYLEEIVVTP